MTEGPQKLTTTWMSNGVEYVVETTQGEIDPNEDQQSHWNRHFAKVLVEQQDHPPDDGVFSSVVE